MNKKQIISILLLFALALPLASCATQPSGSAQTSDNAPETTVAPETTAPDVTTKAPDVTNAPVTSEPVHVHSFGEWTEIKKATCIEEGAKERACSCGEKETLAIAKTTHTEVVDAAVEATCTATGLTEGKHCSVCKEVLIKQETVPMKPHTVVTDPYVPSTCIKAGLSEGSHCSVCKTVIVPQQPLPLGPHTYPGNSDTCSACGYRRNCTHAQTTTIPAVQATCQQGGLTEGKKCSKCGEILVQQVPTAPKSHRAVTIPAVQTTCTTPGFTAGQKCGDCGYIIVAPTPVPAPGHNSNVVIPGVDATYDATGLSEGRKCSVCGTVTVEQEIIPTLPVLVYTVMYRDDLISGQKWEDEFASHIGVDPLRKVSIEGYKFLGWYTKPEGGDLVTNIPKGTKEDVVLYAHFKANSYNITYKDAPVNSNPINYTIEDEVVLATPEWYGLKFINWTDNNGNIVTKIPKGSTGNITLTANWVYEKNLVVPVASNTQKGNWFDKDTGKYYFVYELGRIENIVLEVVGTDDKKNEEISWTLSETVTVENDIAKTVANTVTNSISKTSGWEETKGTENVASTNCCFNAKWNFIVDVGATVDYDFSASDKFDRADSESTNIGTESTDSISSTVTYTIGTSHQISKTVTIPKEHPNGKYSYACTGNVTVYAVITYDSINGKYNIETFNILDKELHEQRIYEAPSNSTANIKYSDELNFDPSIMDEVKSCINGFVYVNYNSNNGTGTMSKSEFKPDSDEKLSANTFTRVGYTFDCWNTKADGSGQSYADQRVIKELGFEKGTTVTLYAQWRPNTYTIRYDSNGGTGTAVTNSTHTYDATKALNANTYTRTGYTFLGWNTNRNAAAVMFTNKGSVKNLTTVNNDTVTLYAIWRANTYTVAYNANGGSGTMGNTTFTYDTLKALTANAFTRAGYTFLGWSTSSSATKPTYTNKTSVKNLTSINNGTVTLYAVWVKTSASATFNADNKTRDVKLKRGNSYFDTVYTGMNKVALLENGYSRVTITVVFDAKRLNLIQYNNAHMDCVTSDTYRYTKIWDTTHFAFAEWTEDIKVTFTIGVSQLNSDGSFSLKWSTVNDGGSTGDGWWLGTTDVSVSVS